MGGGVGSPGASGARRVTFGARRQPDSNESDRLLAVALEEVFELAEGAHGRQYLLHAPVRLAIFADRGHEFAILQLDAVQGDVDLRDVDGLVVAIDELIVACDVRSVVADVAE